MIRKPSLWILAFFGLNLAVHAQEKAAPVQVRAVLHDPVRPVAELFYIGEDGTVVPLEFKPQDLTGVLLMQSVEGSLVLYDKASIDPKNPAASVAASVKLPPDIKRAMVIVLPAPAGRKPAYRMVVIDDSEKAFPKGESRAISLISVETAIPRRFPGH